MKRFLRGTLVAGTLGYWLIACGGPVETDEDLVDDRFSAAEWERVTALSPLPPLRESPTNAHADDPSAADLGELLFEETGLSVDGNIACATCHRPDQAFADDRPIAVGRDVGRRNVPSVTLSAYARWQTWDGSADSVWAQPILALENPTEHGTSRLEIAHRVAQHYREPYTYVFGELPPLEDEQRFPQRGGPGDAVWEAMQDDDRFVVDRIVANVGKALEAFLRRLASRARETPLDRYLAGDRDALTPEARDGLASFIRRGCISCHDGPLLSDQNFHAVRFPDDLQIGPDLGRLEGIAVALASTFRADGSHSDAPTAWPLVGQTDDETLRGQFRTPSLRGVALTAPYGHAGTYDTLDEVVRHYADGGLAPDDPRAQGMIDSAVFPFEPEPGEVDALVAFLRALTPFEH